MCESHATRAPAAPPVPDKTRAAPEACIDRARRRRGTEVLTLSVTGGSVEAIQLDESASFVRCGRLERAARIGSHYHHKDLMALRLELAA